MYYVTIDRESIGRAAAIKITQHGEDGPLAFLAWEIEILGPSRLVVARDADHRAPGHPNRAAWLETGSPIVAMVRDGEMWRQQLLPGDLGWRP